VTPREAREQLAQELREALAGLEAGWTVHASPPEAVQARTVVIAPRSPYRVRGTVCQEEVKLELTVLVARGASQAGMDLLDDICSTIRDAIDTGAVVAYVDSISDIGLVQEVGGADYLAARLQVTAHV
jgi:hypothetical protein